MIQNDLVSQNPNSAKLVSTLKDKLVSKCRVELKREFPEIPSSSVDNHTLYTVVHQFNNAAISPDNMIELEERVKEAFRVIHGKARR